MVPTLGDGRSNGGLGNGSASGVTGGGNVRAASNGFGHRVSVVGGVEFEPDGGVPGASGRVEGGCVQNGGAVGIGGGVAGTAGGVAGTAAEPPVGHGSGTPVGPPTVGSTIGEGTPLLLAEVFVANGGTPRELVGGGQTQNRKRASGTPGRRTAGRADWRAVQTEEGEWRECLPAEGTKDRTRAPCRAHVPMVVVVVGGRLA